MTSFIVTTSLRQNPNLVVQAKRLACEQRATYIERRKLSLSKLISNYGPALIVYQDKLLFVHTDGAQLYFHPDTAMLRMKAPHDPLLDLLGKAPLTILDTTMGLASDSLLMASAGHQVTALEASPLIHLIISHGLKHFVSGNKRLDQAMRSLTTYNQEALDYMMAQPDQSVDVVYADPMFSSSIQESQNLEGIRPLAKGNSLTPDFIKQARRLARKAVIIKAHFKDTIFEDYGFDRQVRKNQKFHYGIDRIC